MHHYHLNCRHREFDDEEKSNIKNIFLLPNVELRILPAKIIYFLLIDGF
jgi:hypothetical protein